jgi:hypothetical protein
VKLPAQEHGASRRRRMSAWLYSQGFKDYAIPALFPGLLQDINNNLKSFCFSQKGRSTKKDWVNTPRLQ